jgi:cytoskeletal protein CcmA (bactofilin family)
VHKKSSSDNLSQILGREPFMANSTELPNFPQGAQESASAGPNSRVPSYLGASITIKGRISGDEDLKTDGKVEGPVTLSNHRFTVGASARVEGEVQAREIIVYGNVKGQLSAQDRIEIKKDSSVLGDLSTPRIMIEDGAYFKGAIEIAKSTTKPGVDPDTLLARAEKDFKMKSIRAADASRSEQGPS